MEEIIKIKDLPKELVDNPYDYICDWAESLLPYTGRKVFEILSLMPPSLILEDLPYKGESIRSNLHCLFLAPPGSGKSTITDLFKFITYSPFAVKSITAARLESEVKKYEILSLIIDDLARISKDMDVMKVIEGLLGEEKRTSRMTMRSDSIENKETIGLLCGVPTDISAYFTGGQIFRNCPVIIFHNREEHSEIGKYINQNIGEEDISSSEKKIIIKRYYEKLLERQMEEPIKGYIIKEEYKKKIYYEWDRLTSKVQNETNLHFFRELHEIYRFLISHSFLNVFNRKIEDGKIVINNNDLNIALKLAKRTIDTKKKIIKCDIFAKKIKDLSSLKSSLEKGKIDEETKNILKVGYLSKK